MSTTKLFVHLSGAVDTLGEKQRTNLLTQLFGEYSPIHHISMPTDKETGQLRNFCFVEVDEGAAESIIQAFDESVTPEGVELSVRVALPKNDVKPFRSNSGGYSNNRGGYGNRDNSYSRGGRY